MDPIDCLECGRAFIPKRSWQKFCSSSCRKASAHSKDEQRCFYCGLVADSIDHLPPRSIRPRIVAMKLSSEYQFVEVRSCRECNSLFGARPPWTPEGRRGAVAGILEDRYRSYLESPDWDWKDILSLGDNLRDEVMTAQAIREITRARIAWSKGEDIHVKPDSKWIEVECSHCGESFKTRKSNQKFCSPTCRSASISRRRKLDLPTGICLWCRKTFKPKRRNQRHCNQKCRRAYNRKMILGKLPNALKPAE